jgi:hypothetical protein
MSKKPIFTSTQTFHPFTPDATVSLGVSATDTAASATITSDATNVSALESVSISNYADAQTVYTFVDTLTDPAVPYEVLIGLSASATLDNLKAAINATGTAGVTWSTGTVAHPVVTATTKNATTLKVEAKTTGYVGTISVTETSQHLSWGTSTLTGGTNRCALGDGDVLVIKNTGSKTAYVSAGISTDTGSTAGYPILAGNLEVISRDPADTHFLAITGGSDTTTLLVTTGEGQPAVVKVA